MDRLSALITTLATAVWAAGLVVGCNDKQSGEPPPGRANVAKVAPTNTASTAAFCDKEFPGETGPQFQMPALLEAGPPVPTGRWQWINVWATWCKPCVEEIPRLVRWRDKLGTSGKPFELTLVSVDEKPSDLAAFRTEHPNTPPSPRLADPSKQTDWYEALGLDANAPVPIHVFVSPTGHVRCARAGGIRETDYAAIEKLLGS